MEKTPYHHENLREMLIEEGINMINEQGYEQLSLRKIAAACGVSHTAPYRHFSDKADLLKAMGEYVEQRFAKILLDTIAHSNIKGDPMIAFGTAYVLFFYEHPQYYQFFTHQEEIFVNLSSLESNYQPFIIFKQQAVLHLTRQNVPPDRHMIAITRMWSAVHGLAGMATMSSVQYDGDWAELTEKILSGVSPYE